MGGSAIIARPSGLGAPPNVAIYEGLSTSSLIFSDFTELVGFAVGVSAVAAGPGAGAFAPTGFDLTNRPGVWDLRTGTSAAGRCFIISRAPAYHVGVGGLTRSATWFRTDAALSTALQRYTLRCGFYSVVLPNVLIHGIGFEYDDSQNGGRWQAICHDGVETSVDTGVLVAAATDYKMTFEVNAAGTSVEFFIDDVSVATIVTNIPAGVGFSLFYNTHIMSLIGTGNRSMELDAYFLYQELTR